MGQTTVRALRCEVCKERLAAMVATYGVDHSVAWCEECAGPALGSLVFHYTVTVRPISTLSR